MKLIGFDIETWGREEGYALQPWRLDDLDSGILCIAFTEPEMNIKTVPKDAILCGWNLKFDLAFLLAADFGPHLVHHKYLDGMLLLKRLYPNLPTYALKPTLEKFKDKLNCEFVSGYSGQIRFRAGTSESYSTDELERMEEYCQRDANYTKALVEYLITQTEKQTLRQAIRESTISYLFADTWQRGIWIDRHAVDLYEKKIVVKMEKITIALNNVELSPTIMRSPKQLREYIMRKLSIKLTERTDKGEYSVATPILKNLYYETLAPRTKNILYLIIKFKELQSEQSKFLQGAQECLQESDLIHSEPMLQGTYTGRLTYSVYQNIKVQKFVKKTNSYKEQGKKIRIGLPIHQIKRGEVRNIFVAPEGYQLVELDFSGQEMRLMAAIANEETMLELFNAGKDLHAYTAASIAEMGYEEFQQLQSCDPTTYKELRLIGKVTNLSLQYRLSAPMLYKHWHDKYGLTKKTLEDAVIARNKYLDIYSGVPRYWKTAITTAQELGYAQNCTGRKYKIEDWENERFKSEQTAINFPIQSAGAEQKVLALYSLREFLHENQILFGWDLHDGLYFYVHESVMLTDTVLEMVEILGNLPYEKAWGWQPTVAFPVEAKIGKRWGELKNI